MVSAAAKKRQQKKKTLRKNQNIQTSKSTTDLNQFLTNDVVLDKEEGSKELGDQELEDLLNEENIENEPAQISHVKQRSGSNYTFFNDADAKADANDQDEDLFGDDIDLLLSDDELDLDIDHEDIHPYEAVPEPTNDVSKSVPELEVADNNTRAFSNVSQKGTEVKLEKYASMILADDNDVQELPASEIDHALDALKDQKDMVPELQYEENVEIPVKSSVEVDLENDDDLLDDELDAELQELLDEDIEVPEMDEGVEVANEIPELQEQDEVAEEIPELQEQHEVAEEIPELQEQDEVAEEVPELQEQHEVANEIPELQEQNEVANEIPELQEQNEVANEIPELQEQDEVAEEVPELQEDAEADNQIMEFEENAEIADEVPELQENIQTAEISELNENVELSNDIEEQVPVKDLAPPQEEQVIEETQPVLESELSVYEPLTSPPTDEIVMEVEQIPEDAVVTAEYSAAEVSPDTGSDPISDALIQDTHEEPEVVASLEELNTANIPPSADEAATNETQPEIDDHSSDEDFFNNISAENPVAEPEVHQPEDQKENDQAFFDQLSAPPAMDKPIDVIPKEDISVNIVSVDEPVDDVEFFNNLNTTAKPEQPEEHADEDSLLEDDSILLSEKEGEIPADDEYSEKKDYTNATVVQTPLDKAQSQELIDELIDSDLLDEDSLLDSDEELETPEEEIQPVVEQKESPKKVSKYAPTVEAVQPIAVHKTSNVGIEPTIISGNAPTVQPTLNIIKPQIIAPSAATVENQKPPVVTKYRTEKHKSDAYDFPVDLVSNLKPPAKAKAIRTASVPKQSFSAAPVPSEAAAVDAVQAPPAVVPSIPVNPYAAPSVHKSVSKKNPYAPQAMSNPSPSLSVQSGNSGIVKPPLNIVSNQPMPGIPTQPHMNAASLGNKPKGPIPASNTDLPFTVAPPKAVPRTKPPVNEPPKNPPMNTTRARAVSNVSASSLSANIYSPSLQNSNAGTFDSASSNFPAGGFNNQRLPSRSGSINKPSSMIGDNKPKNLYAPSFQHIRKNSNASFSPVNHAMGIQNSNVPPTGSPGVHALQTVGLNNANNPLSPITPGTKVSHARSHSSVYAPKKNQGAASKYAPTVHPSVQQAFSQQQMQPPINELPNAFVAANPVVQNGHSRTSSYIPPANNAFAPQNGMFVPKNGMMPNQQFVAQQQFGFPNTMNNQPMMSNMPSVENTFVPNNEPVFQQQPPVANATPFSQFPINTIPVGAPAQTKPVNVLPITNPEELNKRQFPIVRWSASGHVVSLKNSQYQNTTNIKIQSQGSVVFLPKHFLDFPGILIRGKTKAKTLQPWLDETCAFINGDSAYDVDGKVLWSLLNKKIELMDEKSVDVAQLSKFASVLYDATELNKFIENNKNNGFNNNQFQQQNMAASKLDNEGLAQVLTYLRVGEHAEALSIALKSSDFSMSMVIASLMGKEKWTEVVDLYLKKEFQGSGPDSEFAANLLSSIFQVYIGNGKSLIEDFESNELKKHWALNNWNIILASVLSNSKSGTDVNATNNMLVGFLVDMGIFLSKNGKSLASDCCFILADVPLAFNEVIPGSNVVFSEIGAPNSLDGMLLSDLYEYCHKSSLPKFFGFLTLIGSKITHAEVLLLQKQYTTANKILDVCTQMNKELIKTGNAQLKYVYTIDKIRTIIDSKSDSWIGKPTLSGVWGTLDKSFNKLIGGDNIDETADDINTGITKSESKLFDTFDAANSRNISAAEANRSFDFSQNIVNNRAPHLQNSNLAVTQSDTNLYTENAHIYQNNKNMLTKNAVGNMKQESSNNMPPGPPSLSSVASSEQFNQQVANNLAKLHSHSRNQSVDSLLSFAPSNQRLTANTNAKRGSTASHTLAQNARSNEFTNNDTVIKKPLKKYGFDSEAFTEADKPANFFQSAATNKYSPVKKSEDSYEVKQAIHDDIQDAIAGDHETDMFLNKDEPVDAAVNSPPKKSYPVGNEQSNVTNDYTFPSDLTSPPIQSQNPSQTTIHNSGPSTESFPVNRKESDFSPHTSMAPPRNGASFENRFNLPADDYSKKAASMSDLPIPQMVKEEDSEEPEFSAPPKMHKTHSSLASPIKTEVLQQDQDVNNKRVLDADFHPPTKPFNSQYINNVKNQNYMPVTPHQQQFNRGYQSSGWVKTHSRSSSQILAEMTGLNNNSQNPNTGIGGSVYTSRNVSIDSNIASSEPVIRQIRSSSVVFTPDSKRRQSEKVMYDDIVEEDEENDKQNSQNEARLIEKRLAAAREQAEKEKERKEKEEKAKKQEDDKSKKTQENGWFGWLKNNNNPNEKKPIKAKLGQKNQFYYDEKLKRWVNKNATEEEKKEIEAEANSAPPPPPVIKKKSVIPETKPRSGSILGGPTQRTMGVMPPKNPITGESLIPEIEPDRASFNNNNIGSIVVQAVPEETESEVNSDIKNDSVEQLKTPGPGRFSSNVSNVNLTSSATGLDDLLSLGTPGPMSGGPPSNFGSRVGTPGASTSRRNKKANRGYVNVMDHM